LEVRETRLLCYFLVVLGVAAWKFIPRPGILRSSPDQPSQEKVREGWHAYVR